VQLVGLGREGGVEAEGAVEVAVLGELGPDGEDLFIVFRLRKVDFVLRRWIS
jgi:hypothetical protein